MPEIFVRALLALFVFGHEPAVIFHRSLSLLYLRQEAKQPGLSAV
jgi:hypothetical protein